MIDRVILKNGNAQYNFWEDLYDYPLGNIWVRFGIGQTGKIIGFILNMVTVAEFRKKGICTKLHNELLNDCSILICLDGSKDGGEEFLLSFGYRYNKELDLWSYKKGV